MSESMASVYLFGYLEDDYLGRVLVTSDDVTIESLALQLSAWSDDRGAPVVVTNEAGDELDLQLPVDAAGLNNGDIFTVLRSG
jgi:hypothetical protein